MYLIECLPPLGTRSRTHLVYPGRYRDYKCLLAGYPDIGNVSWQGPIDRYLARVTGQVMFSGRVP
jgi:hypothetical protein